MKRLSAAYGVTAPPEGLDADSDAFPRPSRTCRRTPGEWLKRRASGPLSPPQVPLSAEVGTKLGTPRLIFRGDGERDEEIPAEV